MFSQCLAKIKNTKINGKTQLILILSAILTISACAATLIIASYLAKEDVVLPVVDEYDTFVAKTKKTDLKIGVVSGPYGDMFMEAIAPLLAQKGYNVELVYYANYIEPNFALAAGVIDLNMFQHYRHLNNFKFTYNLDLSAIAEIPTAPMAIFSFKHKSFENLPKGASVAIPTDLTNRARALILLESAGLIAIDPYIDKSKTTEKDLVENIKNVQIILLDAKNLIQSLNDCDLAVINGNFAISGGLKLSNALYKEVLSENYINVIAVRSKDLNKSFVRDIIDAVNTEEYKNIVTNPEGKYVAFQRPRSLLRANN